MIDKQLVDNHVDTLIEDILQRKDEIKKLKDLIESMYERNSQGLDYTEEQHNVIQELIKWNI